jgi:hypothetical protein
MRQREERPAITALAEGELIEKLAGRVAARLGTLPAAILATRGAAVRTRKGSRELA